MSGVIPYASRPFLRRAVRCSTIAAIWWTNNPIGDHWDLHTYHITSYRHNVHRVWQRRHAYAQIYTSSPYGYCTTCVCALLYFCLLYRVILCAQPINVWNNFAAAVKSPEIKLCSRRALAENDRRRCVLVTGSVHACCTTHSRNIYYGHV